MFISRRVFCFSDYLANTQQVYQHMNREVTHNRKEASHETTMRTHYMHLHECEYIYGP